jgi:hypothetical protein
MFDVLWSVASYERLVVDWQLNRKQAIRGISWVIRPVEEAVRKGRRPSLTQLRSDRLLRGVERLGKDRVTEIERPDWWPTDDEVKQALRPDRLAALVMFHEIAGRRSPPQAASEAYSPMSRISCL